MSSLNAQIVAHKVSEAIRANKRVVLGKIIRSSGYSRETSLKPRLVTETKSYKAAITPVMDGLQAQIEGIKQAMARKNLDYEEYRTLVYSLDILLKNHSLLSGGITGRQVFVLPAEIMERNGIPQQT